MATLGTSSGSEARVHIGSDNPQTINGTSIPGLGESGPLRGTGGTTVTASSTYDAGDLSPMASASRQRCCAGCLSHCCRRVCGRSCWTSSNPRSQSGFSMTRLMLAYIVYIICGSAVFRLATAQDWTLAQSVYYAMVTGLSIGYGSMQPRSDTCKVFAIIYVIIGACAVALLLSVFVRKLLNLVPRIAAEEWRHQAAVRHKDISGTTRYGGFVTPRYWIEVALWVMLLCWIGLGMVWAHDWQGTPVKPNEPRWSWTTCLFFAVGTVTTAGMLGPEVNEDGKVPSDSAAFLATYAIIGVPLFGAAVAHAASSYVEAQVRRQERERIGSLLGIDEFTAVRELRYGTANARRSSGGGPSADLARRSWMPRLSVDPRASQNSASPAPVQAQDGGRNRVARSPDTGVRNVSGERVLWGDFLALQMLRLRKVDFELLKDLREEYLELIAANPENGGVNWSMLTPLLTHADADIDAIDEE